MQTNDALDVPFRQHGPLLWWVRRYKAGTKCWVWSYWRMEWYRARITGVGSGGDFDVDNLDQVNNDGSFCQETTEAYRVRPIWWFWARRVVAVAWMYAAWRLWKWL